MWQMVAPVVVTTRYEAEPSPPFFFCPPPRRPVFLKGAVGSNCCSAARPDKSNTKALVSLLAVLFLLAGPLHSGIVTERWPGPTSTYRHGTVQLRQPISRFPIRAGSISIPTVGLCGPGRGGRPTFLRCRPGPAAQEAVDYLVAGSS